MKERRRYLADEAEESTYDRHVLASLYHPDSTADGAMRRLRRDIARCPELRDRLQRLGYRRYGRTFTPAQVRLLFRYLGEP